MTSWTHPDYTAEVTVSDGKITATFFVEIIAAAEDRYHSVEHGNVREFVPALRVTTHRTHDDAATIVVRKRHYTVDLAEAMTSRGGAVYWARHRDEYDRGICDDRGAKLEWSTATYKLLESLVSAAREKFIADNPDWQRRSVVRRYDAMIRKEELESANYRRRAEEHDATADGLREERDAL